MWDASHVVEVWMAEGSRDTSHRTAGDREFVQSKHMQSYVLQCILDGSTVESR